MKKKKGSVFIHLKRYINIYFPLLYRKKRIIPKIIIGYIKSLLFKRPVLKSIEFSITTKCNSKCKMCFARFYKNSAKKELTSEEVKKVWNQAKKLGAIGSYLLGGEPTLRKDLFDILDALESKKHFVGLVTNSISITREYLKKLKEYGITFISFSLDSLNSKENDAIRGYNGHFDKVISAIKLAKEYHFRTDVSCLLSHTTLPEIEEFISFALNAGVDYIAPSVMVPVGEWVDNEDEILTDQDWIKINELIKKYPCLKFDFLQNLSMKQMCPGGIEKVAIGPYGDVMTCNVNPLSFGNIRDENLKTIWERIHKFHFFKHLRNFKNCVVAADREYQKEVLQKIKKDKKQPVHYIEHPNNLINYFDDKI